MNNDIQIDLSIIVPVYNHEMYVSKALDSILAQNTKYSYEILIGEDCSTDGSRKIIEKYERSYPERIRAFYRKSNIGATRNGYRLYMEAKGRYIALLEGDDYWCDEHKVERQVFFLDEHQEYIGAACNFQRIGEYGDIIQEKCIDDSCTDRVFTWEDFLEKWFLFQSSTLIYRNIYKAGGDFRILYRAHDIVGDMTLLTILLNRGNIFVMSGVMSSYREVIKEGASNARSIAHRNLALSTYKSIRQLDKLRPYLAMPTDFNVRIASLKADYLIKLLKRTDGYTAAQWKRIQKIGDKSTNKEAVKDILSVMKDRVFKRCVKRKAYLMISCMALLFFSVNEWR